MISKLAMLLMNLLPSVGYEMSFRSFYFCQSCNTNTSLAQNVWAERINGLAMVCTENDEVEKGEKHKFRGTRLPDILTFRLMNITVLMRLFTV